QVEPRLSPRFEEVAETRRIVEELCQRATGTAALENGRLVGYLLGAPDFDWGNRARNVPRHGHAAEPGRSYDIYRDLYAAAAPDWLRAGYFHHNIDLAPEDAEAQRAFAFLLFGFDSCLAVRGLDVDDDVVEADIRLAGPGEIDA